MSNLFSPVFSDVQNKLPLKTHWRRGFLHLFRLPCATRVVPNSTPFLDESTQKRRGEDQRRQVLISCFVQGHFSFPSAFILRNSIPSDSASAVKEQMSVFAHLHMSTSAYIPCLLRDLGCSSQRCPAFAEGK